MLVVWALLALPLPIAKAEFVLQTSLNQTDRTDEVITFDLRASFIGVSPGDYIDLISFSVLDSIAPNDTAKDQLFDDNFARFQLSNFATNWHGFNLEDGGIEFFFDDFPEPGLQSTEVVLGQLNLNIAGLAAGDYTIELVDEFSDAFGEFGNGPELLILDRMGTFNGVGASFSVTAIPEPNGLVLLTAGASLASIRFWRRRHIGGVCHG